MDLLKSLFFPKAKEQKILNAKKKLIQKINEFSRFSSPNDAIKSLNQALRIYDVIGIYIDRNGAVYRQINRAISDYCYRNLFGNK